MERMKIFILSYLLCGVLSAYNEEQRRDIVRNIEFSIYYFGDSNTWPKQIEDLEDVVHIVKLTEQKGYIEAINAFVIVPEQVIFHNLPNTRHPGEGDRIFIMSRNPIRTSKRMPSPSSIAKEGSRYVFTVSKDGKTSHRFLIGENHVQSLLEQAPDFDPASQPFAFVEEYKKRGGDPAKLAEEVATSSSNGKDFRKSERRGRQKRWGNDVISPKIIIISAIVLLSGIFLGIFVWKRKANGAD